MTLTPFADLPSDLQANLKQTRPGAQPRGRTPRVLWLSMRPLLQRGPTPEEHVALRKRMETTLRERAVLQRIRAEIEAEDREIAG